MKQVIWTFSNQLFLSFMRLCHPLFMFFFSVIVFLWGLVRYIGLHFFIAAGTVSSVTPLHFISAVRKKRIFWIFGFMSLFASN